MARHERGMNALLRGMLRLHRRMSTLRRAKVMFWWCYMHSDSSLLLAEMLATMPAGDGIAELYRRTAFGPQKRGRSNGTTGI